MRVKIIVISVIFTIISSILVVVSRRNVMILNISEKGIYEVYLYNVKTEEKINYGKEMSLFGKIYLDNKKIAKDVKINEENHYLIVIQSDDYIGFATFTKFKHEDNKSDMGKHLKKVYEDYYKEDQYTIKLIKKESSEQLKIRDNYGQWRFLKIFYNESDVFVINQGVYTINSIMNDQEVIGRNYIVNTNSKIGNLEGSMQNTNIYQKFRFKIISFSNNNDEFELAIPIDYMISIADDQSALINLDEVKIKLRIKQQELYDLTFYPLE